MIKSMASSKYYVKVEYNSENLFEDYLEKRNVSYRLISSSWELKGMTAVYAVEMDRQEAIALKLSFPILGIMDFDKPIDL